jgi:uncharacterized membrane protein YbhN (UPF0104 family)
MKTATKVSAGLAISALTLFLFVRNLDAAKVAASLASASVPLLLVSIAIGYFGHLSLRAWRWGTMLAPLKESVGFYDRFSTTAIGYAISWLTPGRMGEVARPILLARRQSLPVPGVLAIAAIERLLDAAAIVVLAATAALSAPLWWREGARSMIVEVPFAGRVELAGALSLLGAAALGATAAGAAVLRALVREDAAFLRWVTARSLAGGRGARAWGAVRHLIEGASFLRSPRRALAVAGQSLLLWIVVALGSWIGLLAARVRIPFPGTLLLVVLTVLGFLVPTPGGTGTVHYAYQRGLIDLFGIEPNLASAATFLYHPVSIYIPPILIGLIFAWRDGLSLSGARTIARNADPPEASGRPGSASTLA